MPPTATELFWLPYENAVEERNKCRVEVVDDDPTPCAQSGVRRQQRRVLGGWGILLHVTRQQWTSSQYALTKT